MGDYIVSQASLCLIDRHDADLIRRKPNATVEPQTVTT
jgi:hypothetical protein